jgi:hypothetical protein
MKKPFLFLLFTILITFAANAQSTRIRITAQNTILYATLYDNETARSFIQLLPINLQAFDRIGLVKSTRLPHSLSGNGKRTREYTLGSIFYWPEGPEVAFCYSNHLPKTVVDIIHIGMLETDVNFFRNYSGNLLIDLVR